jgi:hypothetical protein
MKADFHHYVTDPEIAMNEGGKGLIIRFQTVDQRSTGPQRSGKYIHLEIAVDPALRLMGVLQAMQKAMHLPDPPQVNMIAVPPAKDRN